MVAPKRRLPVVSGKTEDEEAPRPGFHWAFFGTVLVFAAWLPLQWISEKLRRGYVEALLPAVGEPIPSKLLFLLAVSSLVPLSLASFFSGFVLGRFGDRVTPYRIAFTSGAVPVALVILLDLMRKSATGAMPVWLSLILLTFSGAVAAAGARVAILKKTK